MSLFRRFFSTGQQRREVEQARQLIERTLRESREPKGCAESAKSGADARDRLLTLVDDIENEIDEHAVIVATDGTLIHPRLIEALDKRSDGELLRLAINSCFVAPQAAQEVNETWPATVKRYQSLANNDELIDEKATVLAAFVVHNLDAATEAGDELIRDHSASLTEEQEILVKIEEAACWYRVVDELAYRYIREHRPLFADFFLDNLAYLLALQGAPPDLICHTMTERSEEYAEYREWATDDINRTAETLLWNAGKYAAVPLGFEHDPIFTTMFGTLFLRRVTQALVFELLSGKEPTNARM